jgi:hypothetical protein
MMRRSTTGFCHSAIVLFLGAAGCSGVSDVPKQGARSDDRVGTATEALVDTSACPPGMNIIVGTDGPDVLVGTNGADCIVGGGGDDTLSGGNGDDVLIGGDGNDQLDGGNGSDKLIGGAGNDILVGDNGNDTLEGDDGNDVIIGGNGDDTCLGGNGDDVIDDGHGNNTVDGGPGVDACSGANCESAGATISTSCTADTDCATGQRCAASGVCVACLGDSECDDHNVCTTDSCQPTVGCRRPPVPDGTACLDNTVCDGAEKCQSGVCTAGAPLVCDDGLFCDGQETCDAVAGCLPGTPPVVDDGIACTDDSCDEVNDRVVHTPDDSLCSSGYFCGTSGCEDINECANGTSGCDPNATCTNTPGSYYCNCTLQYNGNGYTCTRWCTPLSFSNGVTRCVQTDAAGDVRLYLTPDRQSVFFGAPAQWTGTYQQSDEPDVNYCGPTAGKNFLTWYGEDAPYAQLAQEMNTNSWDTGPVVGAAAAVCLGEPICTGILGGIVSGYVVKAGTLPNDLRNSLNGHVISGYVPCQANFSGSLEEIQTALTEGNPLVYLESEESQQLHWAVIVGIRTESDGTSYIEVANSDERPWNTFHDDWSLRKVGPSSERDVLAGAFGLKPYTMYRWERVENATPTSGGYACP